METVQTEHLNTLYFLNITYCVFNVLINMYLRDALVDFEHNA